MVTAAPAAAQKVIRDLSDINTIIVTCLFYGNHTAILTSVYRAVLSGSYIMGCLDIISK